MSLLVALLLASTQPAAAPLPTAAPAVPAAAAKPAKPKLICHVEEGDTGSHMTKRTCLTQQEWDARTQGRSLDEFNSTTQPAH